MLVQSVRLPKFGILSLIPNDLADKVTLFCVIKSDSGPIATFVVDHLDVYHIKEKKVEKLCSFNGTEILVEQIAASPTVNLILGSDKRVYSLGNNRYGQIGNGEAEDVNVEEPFQVPFINKITQVAVGLKFSACLTAEGHVYTWGSEHNGTGSIQYHPRSLLFLTGPCNTPITQLAVFDTGAFALSEKGLLWCWGSSNAHLVAQASEMYDSRCPIPVNEGILADEEIIHVQVDSDGETLFALSADGEMIVWSPDVEFGSVGGSNPTVVDFGLPKPPKAVSLAIEPAHSSLAVIETEKGHFFAGGDLQSLYSQTFHGCKRPRLTLPDDNIYVPVPIRIPDHFQSALDACLSLTSTEEPYTFGCAKVSQSSCEPIGLRWAFANAFDDKTTSDFHVIVGDHTIYVHKAILSIRCGHFRRMFANTECKEVKENRLVINDCSYRVYKAFLRLLYTDTLSTDDDRELSVKEAFDVFDLAGSYLDDSLQRQVSSLIVKFMEGTPEDMLATYKFSIEHLELFPESSLLGIIRDKSFQAISDSLDEVGESSFIDSDQFSLKMAKSLIRQLARLKADDQS